MDKEIQQIDFGEIIESMIHTSINYNSKIEHLSPGDYYESKRRKELTSEYNYMISSLKGKDK